MAMERVVFIGACLLAFVCSASASDLDNIMCPMKLERVGCYVDKVTDRAMPVQMLNAKDSTSDVYWGKDVDWKNYAVFLREFMCDCAMKAYETGYRVIGLQFFAECWSSKLGHVDFNKHGRVNYCVNGNYQPCHDDDMICMGRNQANFIYRVAPTHCDTYYQPYGCHLDVGNVPRPLPNYAMNERDYLVPNWNGLLIDWKNWNDYSPLMICRCAETASKLGHTYFALQFYGECWTGKDEKSMTRDGPSTRCVAGDFQPPNINSYIAVGKDHANYIYELKSAPPAVAAIKEKLSPFNTTDDQTV